MMRIKSHNSTHFKIGNNLLPRGYSLRHDGTWVYLVHFETQKKEEGFLGKVENTTVDGVSFESFRTLNEAASSIIYAPKRRGLTIHSVEEDYDLDEVVIRNDRLYIANYYIPVKTPFRVGTKGATWREVSPGTGLHIKGSFSTYKALVSTIDPVEEDLVVVERTTGIPFINRKRSGLYRYSTKNWVRLNSTQKEKKISLIAELRVLVEGAIKKLKS